MTTMIATCAIEKKNIDVKVAIFMLHFILSKWAFVFFQETISTCRFSQRVALVRNEAFVNEELDPKLVRWL